jgi:hypothetical protein
MRKQHTSTIKQSVTTGNMRKQPTSTIQQSKCRRRKIFLIPLMFLYSEIYCIISHLSQSSSSSSSSSSCLWRGISRFSLLLHSNSRGSSPCETLYSSIFFAYAVDVENYSNDSNIEQKQDQEQEQQRIPVVSTRSRTRALQRQSSGPDQGKSRQGQRKLLVSINEILLEAGKRGLGSGLSGAVAGIVQVLSLMWIRTIISYQSRYGMTFHQALVTLLNDGGIPRLYRGVAFALIQAPLARFVSTAANDSVHIILSNLSWTKNWGPGRTTFIASIVAGGGRIILMRTFYFLLLFFYSMAD